MHLVLIVAGAFVGGWIADLLGALVGMLIGSLLWRASDAERQLGDMRRRITNLEMRPDQPIQVARAKLKTPELPDATGPVTRPGYAT